MNLDNARGRCYAYKVMAANRHHYWETVKPKGLFAMKKPMAIAAESALLLAFFAGLRTPLAQTTQTEPPLTPAELKVYRKAHTVIQWKPREIRARKELENLQPAASQRDLTQILHEVGERVLTFLNNLPNTTATESIQWEVGRGSPRVSATGTFRYMLTRRKTGPWETLEEYRTDLQGKEIEFDQAQRGRLLTSGFTLSLLYFAPDNQASCHYRYLGRQKLGEQETDVVGFAEIPEDSLRFAKVQDGMRTISLLIQGLAWIDAHSHEILRLQTDLLAPPPHTQLRKETTLIDYARVGFPGTTSTFVLPRRVIVDVWEKGSAALELNREPRGGITEGHATLHYRNIHNYSDYMLFRVDSRVSPVP